MQKRLDKEYQEIINNPPVGIEVKADEKERLKWKAVITGPAETPYQAGRFQMDITFPENYPFKAPQFQFSTPIFHPNITEKGELCEDMIETKDKWQPTKTVRQVLELIVNMLASINPDQGLNQKAMNLYKSDKAKFDETAKAETQKHAK